MSKIAIIGAGVAGAAAASVLRSAGVTPLVVDKGRSLGGRLATRHTGSFVFDHGAPFFDPRIGDLEVERRLAPWRPKHGSMDFGERWVGRAGMSDVLAGCFECADLHLSETVYGIVCEGPKLALVAKGAGTFDGIDRLVVTAPAPQTAALLPSISQIARGCSAVEYAPVWCAMVAFPDTLDVPFDVAEPRHDILQLLVRDNSRPGRSSGPDRWVLHARADWSRDHLDLERPEAALRLLAAFREFCGGAAKMMSAPLVLVGHRWRYARVVRSLPEKFLHDPAQRIFAAGDWCGPGDISGAWESGAAAAMALVRQL